jgi:hypothetical protein
MSGRAPSPLIVVVPLVAAILLTLFAWPAARLEPRRLPVGIVTTVGDARLVQRLNAPAGAFEVHRYGDEAAARDAIRDREIYGAFLPARGARGELTVLTAPAASAAVADLLPRAAGGREAGRTSRRWSAGRPRMSAARPSPRRSSQWRSLA